MVNSMLEEKGISFKEIEQEILERYDGKLHEERNKSEFGDKLVHDGKLLSMAGY